MSETFEEWFKKDGNGDFNNFSRDYYAGQWAPLIKHTWNHQQKKIDTIQSLNDKHVANLERQDAEIETLASQLEKAEKKLKSIGENTCCTPCQEAKLVAREYFKNMEAGE